MQAASWSMQPILLLGAAVIFMYLARQVLIPLAFAIVLSLIWAVPITWLQRMHFGRVPAVLTVIVVSIALAGSAGWVFLDQLLGIVNGLPAYQQNLHNKMAALTGSGKGSLGRAAQSLQQLGNEFSAGEETEATPRTGVKNPGQPIQPEPVEIVAKPTNNLQYFRDVLQQLIKPLGIVGIVLIFSIFLLIERQDVRNRILRLVGLGQLNVMTQALDDATQRVSRYLLLQFAVNATFGATIGLGLYIIGLPYAVLWGAVAGFLRLVPYLGTLVATTLPLLLSLAVFTTWGPVIWVLVLFVVVEVITGNWVEPRLYGAHTGVSSLALLVTTMFWTIIWGPAGLVLSTPLTVCVVVLGRYFPQVSFLHILLGDEPVLAPDMRVYQRLLAMDREEAREVADLFLKQDSLVNLYDRVLAPALTLAEQDRHKGALDATREKFISLSIKEMIAEFRDLAQQETSAAVKSTGQAVPGRVLCLPAGDDADEITAAMLAQLLQELGIPAIAFPAGEPVQQAFALIEPQRDDVICMSALPPFAFAQARAVSRQVKLRFPVPKVVVGVWGFAGDVKKALDRFDSPRPERILVSMADAIAYFQGAEVESKVPEGPAHGFAEPTEFSESHAEIARQLS